MAYKVKELNIYELGAKVATAILLEARDKISAEIIQLRLRDQRVFAKLDEIELILDKFADRFTRKGFMRLVNDKNNKVVEIKNNEVFVLMADSPSSVEIYLKDIKL
jgi:hypothetical protein